jgi:PPP family 3-phenylpropionic acid transporter
VPVLDALAIEASGGEPKGFGRFRKWGSIGFMLSVFGISFLKQNFDFKALHIGPVLAVFFAVMCFFLPAPRRVQQPNIFVAVRILARDRVLLLILLAAALHFSAHMAHGSFLSLHVKFLGLPTIWTGIAISAGICLEIFVMANGERILDRYSEEKLFFFATCLAFLRWLAMFYVGTGWLLTLCQLSHGLTFGLFCISAVSMVSKRTSQEAPVTGQTLLAAAVGGVGSGGGVLLASHIESNYSTQYIYLGNMALAGLAILVAWRILWISSGIRKIG